MNKFEQLNAIPPQPATQLDLTVYHDEEFVDALLAEDEDFERDAAFGLDHVRPPAITTFIRKPNNSLGLS